MNKLSMAKDGDGDNTFALPLDSADSNNKIDLIAGTIKLVPVPAGTRAILFNSTTDFYAHIGAGTVVSTGDIVDGTGAQLNPVMRYIGADITSMALLALDTDGVCQQTFFEGP